jgi:alginate O-acetyltransferase complex protein AlgI
MLFNSYNFLFVFLPLTIACYLIFPQGKKNLFLTLASFIFYAYWSVKFCLLLLFSIIVNYVIGNKIYLANRYSDKQIYLIFALVVNLGLLAFFKYANFFLDSLHLLFPFFNFQTLDIILPIGISFFTFQGMSYSIDIFTRKSIPVSRFIDFSCYISMFPQLIAGPIIRFNQIADQLRVRDHTSEQFFYGIRRFILGLGKKVLIADTMAYISHHHLYQGSNSGISIWIGITAFSLQIYFDFSGYSDMAIGLGRVFGFTFPENFNYPYSASGIYDFWRRWHMTLSGWLRDYLYIPLGGSRCSTNKWIFNIMVTFLLCGLWHGASWTFVVWGGYFGILIILERPYRKYLQHIPRWLLIPLINILVIIGWVFFKAASLNESVGWLKAMFGYSDGSFLSTQPPWHIVLLGVLMVICWGRWFRMDKILEGNKYLDVVFLVLFVASIVSILGVNSSPFLYFQF